MKENICAKIFFLESVYILSFLRKGEAWKTPFCLTHMWLNRKRCIIIGLKNSVCGRSEIV